LNIACDRYQELASALVDGCLEAVEIAELQRHLGKCGDCRIFMNRVYRTRDLLRAEEAREQVSPVPSLFAADVTSRIANERVFPVPGNAAARLSSGISLVKHFMGAAAAAAVLLTAGWSSYRLASVEEEPTVVASLAVTQDAGEETMASYFREYALQTMDTTFLGLPQGVELADFEAPGRDVE
jgi:anti-sigma-K factor RskA